MKIADWIVLVSIPGLLCLAGEGLRLKFKMKIVFLKNVAPYRKLECERVLRESPRKARRR